MKLRAFTERPLRWVSPADSFDRAICLMEEHSFHHLPVVENGRIVGIVSDRDILLAVGWKLEIERLAGSDGRTVVGPRHLEDVMSHPAVCLSPEDDVSTAAKLMTERRIHAVVIASHHQPLGIVTCFDVLNQHAGEACPSTPAALLSPVRGHMRQGVFTIGPKDSLISAARLMREKSIHHLPVTVDGTLIGLVSDRDLRRATGEEMVEDAQAEATGEFYIGTTMVMEVMSRHVETATEEDTVLHCLNRMVARRYGCMPIVRGDELVGILTDTDLLRIVAGIEGGAHSNRA